MKDHRQWGTERVVLHQRKLILTCFFSLVAEYVMLAMQDMRIFEFIMEKIESRRASYLNPS